MLLRRETPLVSPFFGRILSISNPAPSLQHSRTPLSCPVPLRPSLPSLATEHCTLPPFPRAVFPHQTLQFSLYHSMAQFCSHAFILVHYHCNLLKFLLPYTSTPFSGHTLTIPPSTDSRPFKSPNRISVRNQAQTHASPRAVTPQVPQVSLLPIMLWICSLPSEHHQSRAALPLRCHFTLQLTTSGYYQLDRDPSHLIFSALEDQ